MTHRKTSRLSGRTSAKFLDFLREQADRFATSQGVLIEVAVRFFAVSGEWTMCRTCGRDNLNAGPKGNRCECDHCGECLWPGECENHTSDTD